jgi:tRNA-uridine 2-sulfurtransferase
MKIKIKKINKNNKKCVLLFSGGLDSRLAFKIMQEQRYKITCLFFKLPFSCSNFQDVSDFVKSQKGKLVVFDCTKGKLFKEYWKDISQAKYGRGQGVNPCKDCKIFMFKQAQEFADKNGIGLIVTGEVLGERPMSQLKNSMNLIEKESGLKERLLRPLSARLLPETNAEKKGLVIREDLFDIQGRKRDKQIALAKKFKIKYPGPAGGCLLCEKLFKKRFNFLFKRGLNEKELSLVSLGRQFVIHDSWIILGRNQEENKILESLDFGKLFISEYFGVIGGSVIVLGGKVHEKIVGDLITAYSKKGDISHRNKFEKFKI